MDDEILRALPVAEVIARVGVAKAVQLKHVASLLFTYRCTIACRHCLFNCSPHLPDVRASLDDGVEFLLQLRATDRVIHIAGGEAMMYYDEVLAICRAARAEGVAPHFVETNASWCKTAALARQRYAELLEAGVQGLLISADPYHQAFVRPEVRRRAFELAVEAFGRENVMASDASVDDLVQMRELSRDEARLGDYARQHQPRLVGRAGESLAPFFPDRPLADLADDPLWHSAPRTHDCSAEFDPETMWEIHLDPYGNVQTCCGIIVGNCRETPLRELMRQGFHTRNELVRMVYERGPFALLEHAVELGYEPAEAYKQKCHLCWEVRKFLRPYYPETFGPAEIYG